MCQQNTPTMPVSPKVPNWREECAKSAERAGVRITPPPRQYPAVEWADNAEVSRQLVGTKGRGAHQAGAMNKLETKYAQHLELRRQAGEIQWWVFEGIKLRLAPATFYNPDFLVQLPGGELELHEVKGHWEDDARVKVKVAAVLFPGVFAIFGVRWDKELGWQFETFKGGNTNGR